MSASKTEDRDSNSLTGAKFNIVMKKFKKINGDNVNVVEHTLKILKEKPNVKIHIGSDSQNNKRFTYYAVVISYHYGGRGVHYIYSKNKVKRISNLWERLWKEVELTLEIAEWLNAQLNVKIEIDIDFNKDKKYKSNNLLVAARGWCESLGYKVNIKPDNIVSTYAADYHCNHK